MRYAVSEKNTLEQKHLREQIEKKHKDALREIEILQHKVSSMSSEKARICQMLDNKVRNLYFMIFIIIFLSTMILF